MLRLLLVLLTAVTFSPMAFTLDDDEKNKKEMEALTGTWVVIAAEQDGEALDRIIGGKLTFDGKKQTFVINTKSGSELKGHFTVDASKKPKQINFNHNEGVLTDKKWEGIYELDGDTFKYCYAEAEAEKPRPTEMKAPKDSGCLFITLEKEKKK